MKNFSRIIIEAIIIVPSLLFLFLFSGCNNYLPFAVYTLDKQWEITESNSNTSIYYYTQNALMLSIKDLLERDRDAVRGIYEQKISIALTDQKIIFITPDLYRSFDIDNMRSEIVIDSNIKEIKMHMTFGIRDDKKGWTDLTKDDSCHILHTFKSQVFAIKTTGDSLIESKCITNHFYMNKGVLTEVSMFQKCY